MMPTVARMNTPTRLVGFVAILAIVFGGAYGLGRAWPDRPVDAPTHHGDHSS